MIIDKNMFNQEEFPSKPNNTEHGSFSRNEATGDTGHQTKQLSESNDRL